jgi:beta-N-acetylhexosaminidase
MSTPRAVVYGVSGTSLTADERAFLRDANPLGFILFGRNCHAPETIRALTADLRNAVGRADAPVLIDQEGGTVMRLRPPLWHDAPSAQLLGNLFRRAPERAEGAARALGAMFGAELRDLGIDVDCAPVADLGLPETTGAIGTRAYSDHPDTVVRLAQAMADGLMSEGCLPVVKHLPGHGRAKVDSHRVLPRVATDIETLESHDFAVFRTLRSLPLGMSAHVVFEAIDPEAPATISQTVIDRIIRGHIGFEGFLFSDDIAMSALHGTPAARAQQVLSAGCDAVLHCTGNLAEMVAVADIVPTLSDASEQRWNRARHGGVAVSGHSADHHARQLAELLKT